MLGTRYLASGAIGPGNFSCHVGSWFMDRRVGYGGVADKRCHPTGGSDMQTGVVASGRFARSSHRHRWVWWTAITTALVLIGAVPAQAVDTTIVPPTTVAP